MRVAVLGAGYAGLTLARKLESSLPESADLVVVDESETHVVQHELHRVVRRPAVEDEISIPLTDLLDCEVRQAAVTSVDPEAGVARLDGADDLEYDVGAVCLGAETAFYDIPGLREHATPLKRLDHAREIRERYLGLLDEGGRVVVGGAGLSGVQVAGELVEMARAHESDGDGEGNSGPEVVLLEQLDSVAPSFPEAFQRAVADQLGQRGVEIRTETTVEAVDGETITVADGADLSYDQLVWTGGLQGPSALDDERPVVRSDLRLADETFAVGDVARVVDTDGEPVPASAQAAIREAGVAAENVTALVEHRLAGAGGFEPRLDRYTFDSLGWLVSVGDGAVAQVGDGVLTGQAALALKTSVGAGYLGSVGAVENAVELVQSELGLAVDGADDDASDPEAVDTEP
ncbi:MULTISPECIES: NAD(P)/FAD-dependent oxidoreductase [Halomicrobium]|uniref:FAD-dependent pyridine nucleotide-disulphide oxidoreductase n=2 Tax=Halomicrobium mukohataei TaxID=57705 RepID=C7NWM5_HALMD|nr:MULTISPECIES: FAD-dependent oxidoreductase [Halomicrobium]ACV48235.1 FAD-dependent pyridine nucleotide-disulphide oxidoreductase [Halomicrobium mukohataei DSM 12286]QCD66656.1 NADH dehydrogenase FAD-containing subunit [Halomicrobium mukohataei]QFR21462.1 NADH dehydrogenase FAD-containing subunit [Halomicrobium sp. ZPS1]